MLKINIISNSIGQGEVQTTLAQLSNVMAIIANKGWYYTPHLVDSIEGGDTYDLLAPYKVKHYTDTQIEDTVFEAVHNGMQGVMEYGTGEAARVPGIVVCGKTGTVENYYKGAKQKDHAFFGAFAPRNNPRIAIAVMCENAGFGAASAAPIASLMIEKYLNDSIAGKERQDKVEALAKLNLIPERMRKALFTLDSLKTIKENLLLQQKAQQEATDTAGLDEEQPVEVTTPSKKNNSKQPLKDSTKNLLDTLQAAILNDDEKNQRRVINKV